MQQSEIGLSTASETRGVEMPGGFKSFALSYRVWGIPAVFSKGIFQTKLWERFGKSQPYWGYGQNNWLLSETGRIRFGRCRFQNTKLSEFLWLSPSSRERIQWVTLSLLFVCQSDLTEFVAELTESGAELTEFSSGTVLSKQYSQYSAHFLFSEAFCAEKEKVGP